MTEKGEIFNRAGHGYKTSCESVPLVQVSTDVRVLSCCNYLLCLLLYGHSFISVMFPVLKSLQQKFLRTLWCCQTFETTYGKDAWFL